MKNTEKRQNTDCIFKQLSEGKEKKPKRSHNGKERQLFSSSGKISALRICFTDLEFREQNLPFDVMSRDVALFFSPLRLLLKRLREKIWIYLHYTHFT